MVDCDLAFFQFSEGTCKGAGDCGFDSVDSMLVLVLILFFALH